MPAPSNMLELQKLLANIVVVDGNSITFDFTDVLIKDNIFQVNANNTHDMNTGTAGFAIDRLTNDQVLFLWNEAVKAFQLKEGINLTDLEANKITAQTLATNSYTLPSTDGTANYVLKTDGAGNVSWAPDASESGGSVSWGSVTGTLSSQIDLQSALNSKADSSHNHTLSNITDWPVNVTVTEIGTLDGVTSSIQTQLDSMAKTDGSRQYTGNLIPSTDITYDLGSATNRWRDLYLSGNTIDLGGAKISAGVGGAIKLPPNSVVDDGVGGTTPLTASNAEDMDSGIATSGQVIIADGVGGASWANQTLDGQTGAYYTGYTDQAEADAKAYADGILSTETSARTTADTTLQSNIDTEAATRLANDNTLQTNIDTEAATRLANDNTLQTNIDTEASTRATADTNLENTKVAKAGDTMSGSLLVDTHNTYNLGSDAVQWNTAFFKKVDVGWKDLIGVPVIPQKALPGTAPLWKDIGNGIWGWSFSDNLTTPVYVDFHILHDIKVGSKLYPHIHWAPMGYSTGTVVWKIEYVMAKGHGQGESISAPMLTTSVSQAANGIIGEHMISEVTEPNAFLTPEIDSIVKLKVTRDVDNPADTYYGNVILFLVDLHYEADRIASVNKSPDFYGGEG